MEFINKILNPFYFIFRLFKSIFDIINFSVTIAIYICITVIYKKTVLI